MADLSTLAARLRQIIDVLDGTQEQRTIEVASDLFAQIQNRIIQAGTDSTGAKIPGYSKTQVPKFFFHGRGRNSGSDERVKKSKSKTLSYTEFRQLNNLQTDHVDLYFTGEMWRGTGIKVTNRIFRATTVSIQGLNPNAAEKIDWNSARYGESILTPSPAEIALATKKYGEATLKAISTQ